MLQYLAFCATESISLKKKKMAPEKREINSFGILSPVGVNHEQACLTINENVFLFNNLFSHYFNFLFFFSLHLTFLILPPLPNLPPPANARAVLSVETVLPSSIDVYGCRCVYFYIHCRVQMVGWSLVGFSASGEYQSFQGLGGGGII